MHLRTITTFLVAVLAVVSVSDARAEVVIETVTVGDPGNSGDTRYPVPPVTSFGGVAYTYNIGTFEVTAGQYRDFLNAVDPAGSNPYGVYLINMEEATAGCKITWNAGSTTYDFSGRPSGTEADWENRPVNFVSWGDAARFCNWLHNDQPTGQLTEDPAQDAGLTEDGSYYLDGATTVVELIAIVREPDATWVIPSEDEWYKAAYYDGGSDVYYDYSTISDNVPSNQLGDPTDPGNNATFYDGGFTIGHPYYRTEVGAHENSDSPYATFDQGGNLWEWNEAVLYVSYRGLRGGSWGHDDFELSAALRSYSNPSYENHDKGFRVAEVVPEQAPEVDAGDDLDGVEGVELLLSTSFTDDPGDTHTATIDWGDGWVEPGSVTEDSGEGTGTVSGSHFYADNGTHTIDVTVDDGFGSGSDSILADIFNASPSVSAGPDRAVTVGSVVNLASSDFTYNSVLVSSVADASTFADGGFDDPVAGTAEDFVAEIDWDGDGVFDAVGTVTETNGGPGVPTTGTITATHTYETLGFRTVVVRITDDDGATTADSVEIEVTEAGTEIPAVSEWGLMALTLLLLGGGVVIAKRRAGLQV